MTIIDIIKKLEKQTGLSDIIFDNSRAWSLYTTNHNYNCHSFGAYRTYLGGGIRGKLEHNGNKKYRNFTKGVLFARALAKIEKIYYSEDYYV